MMDKLRHLNTQKLLKGFVLKKTFEVPELRLFTIQLEHEKTRAKYFHLARDDPNKTFAVQFLTNPTSNSGVSHILEHTVLCGSKRFPCRDPFFKMLRRSQATFMNALTASDWTMYPFSTMNDRDFRNLLQVYLDAVFNPKLEELDFMQEGWRLEPTNLGDASSFKIKGVVYNEMKGVFSNSFNRFAQTAKNKLLPNTYGFISGGHPESIPSLTVDDLRIFHLHCYHPSNSTFYTYGNVDLEQTLDFINSEYLQNYEALALNNAIQVEPEWDKPQTVELFCEPDPISAHPDRQCSVCLSYRLFDIRDTYTNFVSSLLSGLLVDGDNAPFYCKLIESGYALDWIDDCHGMDSEARTTSFHIGVQGVCDKDLTDFPRVVQKILSEVARDGFPKERIEAALHQYELAIRRDSSKFGLNLILGMSNAVNHGADVGELLQINALIARFRADLESNPNLLQNFITEHMLSNRHQLTTIMRPDSNWRSMETKKEEEFLRQMTENLSSDDKIKLTKKACDLSEKQQLKEDISCLPCLDLFDIGLESRLEPFTMIQTSGNCPVQLNEATTNDLVYFHSLIDLKDLPQELLPYVPLFCELFPRLGAGDLSYSEMHQEMQLHTGGLNVSTLVTPDLTNSNSSEFAPACQAVHLSGHCLGSKLPKFFTLWTKLFSAPDWSAHERLLTLIMMSLTGDWSANAISHSAHRFAMCHAAASISHTTSISELWCGMEQLQLMKHIATQLNSNMESNAEQYLLHIIDRMEQIWQYMRCPSRMKFSLHGDSEGLKIAVDELEKFVSTVPSNSEGKENNKMKIVKTGALPESSFKAASSHTYFVMPYNVHYVAQAIPGPSFISEQYASHCVLAQLLTSKFLHCEIREKGGAYGGGAVVRPEVLLFYSYRDPNALNTLNNFQRAIEWARDAQFAEQDINEAKLAVFQSLDYPVTPGALGLRYFLTGVSDELNQINRNRLFAVDADKLHQIAQQLSDNGRQISQTILGPEESPDWSVPTADKSGSKDETWNRVVLVD